MDLNYLEEPIEVHKAQAMCYAYIYGYQSGKDKIQVPDDLLSDGERGDQALYGRFYYRETEKMV